jgi:hypothetical protein
MSDDSFIREVEEELRNEQLQNFWSKYGKLIIAGAVAVVIGVAGYRYYEYSSAQTAASNGDAFMEAVRLSTDGKSDEAIAAFSKIEAEGSEAYQVIAKMRLAAELHKKGESAKAVEAFDAVVADTSADENFRSISRIRAAMILVDSGSVADVESRVTPLMGPNSAYLPSAREALGLAHFKAGDLDKAFEQFDELAKDPNTPSNMRQRVTVMLGLIASQGGPVRENQ